MGSPSKPVITTFTPTRHLDQRRVRRAATSPPRKRAGPAPISLTPLSAMRRLNTAKSGIHKPERPAVLNFQSAVKENSVLTSMPLSRPQDENVFLSPKHDRKISSDSELKQLLLENSKLMQKLAKNQEKIMELVKNR